MLECKSIECGSGECAIAVTEIPDVHIESIEDLADACCCRLSWDSLNSVSAYGSNSAILNFESEILALVAKITYLENCFNKS